MSRHTTTNPAPTSWSAIAGFIAVAFVVRFAFAYFDKEVDLYLEVHREYLEVVRRGEIPVAEMDAFNAFERQARAVLAYLPRVLDGALVGAAIWLWSGRSLARAAAAFALYIAFGLAYANGAGPVFRAILNGFGTAAEALAKSSIPLLNIPGNILYHALFPAAGAAISTVLILLPLSLVDRRFWTRRAWWIMFAAMFVTAAVFRAINWSNVEWWFQTNVAKLPLRLGYRLRYPINWAIWAAAIATIVGRGPWVESAPVAVDPVRRRARRIWWSLAIVAFLVLVGFWLYAVWLVWLFDGGVGKPVSRPQM